GNDTLLLDLCEDLGVPTIGLYGPTEPREPGAIESSRNGLLPSFDPNERNKTINLIPPEQVANGILRALDLPELNLKTVDVGSHYNSPIFDICPDHQTNLMFSPNSIFNIRMDWYHNPQFLIENLQR